MKTKKTNEEAAAPKAKGKIKIETLKRIKKDLLAQGAEGVKGGADTIPPPFTCRHR